MHIKKLVLKHYNRFFLSNISKLEYTPNHSIQIIASRNLAGKSSLLKQLNPLPIDLKKDFKQDGYKYIEIEHLGKEYRIKSDGKNSFICNDVELNPGGTKKVQLDLIKEHFNLTPAILDILQNTNSLTVMSPSERKHWFTEMSNVDYVFPIKVYNLLKQRHRDILGFIKLTQDTIIKHNLDNDSKINILKLKEDKKHLEEYISYLLTLYNHKLKDIDIDGIKSEMNNLFSKLEVLLVSDNKDTTIKSIEDNINLYNGKIISYDNTINKLKKEIDELDKVKGLEPENILKAKLDKLYENKKHIESNIYLSGINNKYNDIWNEFSSIHSDIIDFYNTIVNYNDIRMLNKEEIENIKNTNIDLNNKYRGLQGKYNIIKNEIDHMLKHKTDDNIITCSKCSHSWYLGYDPKKHEDLNKELEEITKILDNTKVELDKSNTLLNRLNELREHTLKFKELLRYHNTLTPIWNYLFNKHNIISCNVSELLFDINKLLIDLDKWKDIDSIVKEIDIIENNISNSKVLEGLSNTGNVLDTLIKNLEETTKLKNTTLKEIEILKQYLNTKLNIKEIYNRLQSLIKLENEYYIDKKHRLHNEYIKQLVEYIKGELYNIDNIIIDNETSIKKIEESNKILEEYKVKEKALSVACKVLSPDEGLIAKSINGFITVIVNEMNKIINSIWTFDLEVLPCEVSDTSDLDYKFKVKVNNNHIVEDVSKLSSSGKEIVDLAFRLVFTKYMGLHDMPLLLDEFGNTFDKAHRSSAYAVIDKILSSNFKQIFIVSHYESIYCGFKNIDFNVLDPENIDIQNINSYNNVLKLEHY